MNTEQIKAELLSNIDDIAKALKKGHDIVIKEHKGINIFVTGYTKINNK
jgi:hypothetical protein